MPSEYVMYLSIVLIGALAIAGISATMVGLNNTLEDRAIETSLKQILQKVSESIINLNNAGNSQVEQGATELTLYVSLTLPNSIQDEEYIIEVYLDEGSGYYMLRGYLIENEDVKSTVSLYIQEGEVTITGSIESTSSSPLLIYSFNGVEKKITLTG
ncbi:MAG: DUF7266 family protein [Candidatus Heimdallarchaeaceae archaeon]